MRALVPLLMAAGLVAFAQTPPRAMAASRFRNYSGSGAASIVTSNFSYDGKAAADLITFSLRDNLGGKGSGQAVLEYQSDIGVCTAPDGTGGTAFIILAADSVTTYATDQLTAHSNEGHLCASNTTASQNGIEYFTITGGTGKLASVSGTFTLIFTSQVLADGAQGGGSGMFRAKQFTIGGEVTK